MTRLIKPARVDFGETAQDWGPDALPEWHPSIPRAPIAWEPYKTTDPFATGLRYDESLRRLRAAGYVRHGHPREYVELLMRADAGDYDAQQIRYDLYRSPGEWTCLIAYRSEGSVLLYEGLQTLFWSEQRSCYGVTWSDGPRLVGMLSATDGKNARSAYTAEEMNAAYPELFEYLWGRPYDRIPRNLLSRLELRLPARVDPWPLAFGTENDYCLYPSSRAASRGVRNLPAGDGGSR